ncbi:hypothetical protein H8N01_14520 [Streptomyces sp. AC536]|uniref:hypothetical protein n=1 Tax=Streptomyces buecherae TaxID=2763006 RepID=UPI00164D396B|nr:hypothetical protein [Streptomyces buecherae]MBC3983742.1 hypothetical protein [Streptomyces buecherae]QNJ43417.1 hypothetical protein H7H31_29800 [Streptomyces buecherae]
MRNKTKIAAAAAVAALALTLTGCGDDGDDGGSLFGKPDKGGNQAIGGGEGTGGDEIKIPGPDSTGLIGGSSSTGTSGSTGSTGGSDASSAQGLWYTTERTDSGQVGILSVSGSAFVMRMGTMTCSGTSDDQMNVNATCQGETMTGKAAISEGGQKLTITWSDSGTDEFSRQMPTS